MAFTTRDGKTQTVLAEINMIPFIDIVLVLLIIFMITAPVIQSGIEVVVPRTRTVREITEERMVVTIDAKETLYLQNLEVRVKDLAQQIQQKLPAYRDKSVYLRADVSVKWEILATILDHLKDGGIEDIVFVTQPLEGSR